MTRTKAEKIRKGIDNKIRKATVDMEWWADFWGFTVDEYEEFLDMAIKALEQETVSRETYTHEYCLRKKFEMKVFELERKIAEQEPSRATGKWYIIEYEYFTCDQCGEYVWNGAEYTQEAREMLKNGDFPNYCPNCGARMESDNE